MNQTELNQELESLSNKFKSSIFNHFKAKGFNIQLKTIDFSISNEGTKPSSEGWTFEKDRNELSLEATAARCYVNEQGQVVCRII